MPLNKQTIDVILDKGLSNKTSDQLTLDGNLKELENRVFNKLGRLDKRKGLEALSSFDLDGNNITNMYAISKYNEDELVLFANNYLYSYLPSINKWQYKDDAGSASVKIDKIIDGSSQQEDIDSCYANGITLFTWVDSASGDILACTYDTTSSTIISNNILISTTGSHPRCIAINNNLFVFYCDSTSLKYKYCSSGTPTTFTSGTISSTYLNVHADFLFDVTNIGNTGYVFYKSTTASTVQQLSFNTAGEVLTDNTISATVTGSITCNSFLASDGFYYIGLGYRESGTVIKGAIYTQFMNVKKAITTIDSGTTNIVALTLEYSITDDNLYFIYQTNGSSTITTYITYTSIVVDSGSVATPVVLIRSVGIASKAFSLNGTIYLNILHDSTLQSTVFTVELLSGNVICSYLKGLAGALDVMWAPPSVNNISDNMYQFAINKKGIIRSENETLFSLLGLANATIDFTGPYIYTSANINNNLLIAGGNLMMYDGVNVVEQGFHLYPEDITQTDTDTTGGYMSNGTYQYVALYQWVDSKGNIHKSAPSIPISYTTSGGGSTQTVTITVPTLRITQKLDARGDITVELYRTEASGTIFYKVTSITSPTYNDTTVDTMDIIDTLADSTIISNEILYTTGGVLDNIGAPSANIITIYKNRVFLSGLEDKNEIRYSKITRDNEGISFNEGLLIKADPKGGDITALQQLDDKLVIFKHSSIFALVGDGPTDTGEGDTYSTPELISTDVGCTDGNSIILGPDGLFFKSAKGIYLLNRANQVEYIGNSVEDYNTYTITSAVLLDDVNEIRFTTNSNNILVYNYYFKTWSVLTGDTINDSLIYGDVYTAITDSSELVVESGETYKNKNSFINSKISTGWIRLTGLQGYQRVYRVSAIGYVHSAHWLKMTIYTDYSDVIQQEILFDVANIMSINSGYYGDGTYNDGIYSGEDSGVYQFQAHMKQQKCQSIRIVIEDIYENSSASNTGQGMDITGVSLQIGVKQGLNKLINSKST